MSTPNFESVDLDQLELVSGGRSIFSEIAHAFTSIFGSSSAHQVQQSAEALGPTPPQLGEEVAKVDNALGETDQPYTDPTDIQVDTIQDGNEINKN